jgi:integrase
MKGWRDDMSEPRLLDTTGRRRSPAATPGHRAGCSPANKGVRYPADPPRIEEIIAVMRQAGSGAHADRVRALIAILWRAGLRISEALALTESDLDPQSGYVLIRAGKGGKRRMVGMDDWAWEHVNTWTTRRIQLPIGPLFCILDGPTRGRAWSATGARAELRQLAAHAGVRRRFAPHQLPARARCRDGPRRNPAAGDPAATRDTPTSGSPRSTSKASTQARSSTPSTTDAHQSSQRAPA